MSQRPPQAASASDERGLSLILVLVVAFFASLLASALLFTTEIELASSTSQDDAMTAMNDLDNAVTEVVYRLNLKRTAAPPPAGSQITVNDLVNYDASINPDPWGLVGNDVDDDLDGLVDEVDELNLNRDWTVRVLLATSDPSPGPPWEYNDILPLAGPLYGSKLAVPTIQARDGWREYSVRDVSDPEVLTIRFKLDTDVVGVGDSEGDGPEIVFYDRRLARNSTEDRNTLSALGGDGNPNTDSPYNITWSDGTTTYPATGSPVLLLTTTSHVKRRERTTAERTLAAEIVFPVRTPASKAVCGCSNVRYVGTPQTDSYNSDIGAYGGSNVYNNGDVGANGNLELDGTINGDAEAGGSIVGADAVTGDATAGGTITGDPGGDSWENTRPLPDPCDCESIDEDALIAAAQASNDNSSLPPGCQGPNLTLAGNAVCTLDCGTYFYNDLQIVGNAEIVIGDTSCGPVKIYVDGAVQIGGIGIVNGGTPEDLIIVSTVDGDIVSVGGTADFVGIVYAPDATVDLRGTADIYGSVTGKEVTTNGDQVVHYDESLMDFWEIRDDYLSVAWLEVD